MSSDTPRRILLVRLGAVGDVVRCLPALELLRERFPAARLCWLSEPAASGLLEGHPALDRVLVFRRREARWPWSRAVRDLKRDMRAEGFDMAVDFHGHLKSALFARASGARLRYALGPPLSREGSHLVATHAVEPPPTPWRPAHFLALAAAAAGCTPPAMPDARLLIPPGAREKIDRFLETAGAGDRKVAVLYPGASAGAAWKRWPADRYGLVGRRLEATGRVCVVVAWGPGEEDLAEEVAGSGPVGLRPAPPTTLPELTALLARADLFIGPDTGPAHIAGAAGTRVLGIYGPSDAERNRPLGEGHVLLTEGPPMRLRIWNRALMAERTAAIPANRVTDEAARMLGIF